MDTSVEHNIEQRMSMFLTKLKGEYSLYENMVALCQNERRLIDEGDWGKLRESIANRKVILDKVIYIEEEIKSLKEEWNSQRETFSSPLKNEILLLLKKFKDLMETLVVLQKENENNISKILLNLIEVFKETSDDCIRDLLLLNEYKTHGECNIKVWIPKKTFYQLKLIIERVNNLCESDQPGITLSSVFELLYDNLNGKRIKNE